MNFLTVLRGGGRATSSCLTPAGKVDVTPSAEGNGKAGRFADQADQHS